MDDQLRRLCIFETCDVRVLNFFEFSFLTKCVVVIFLNIDISVDPSNSDSNPSFHFVDSFCRTSAAHSIDSLASSCFPCTKSYNLV
jgi:hypothetical protein